MGDGEGGGLAVVGSFGGAVVVEAAEHAVEEVALGAGVAVAIDLLAVVMFFSDATSRNSHPLPCG